MSWAQKKTRELMSSIVVYPPDSIAFERLSLLVEQAIRGTIERCAEVADDGEDGCGCADAIRKLASHES